MSAASPNRAAIKPQRLALIQQKALERVKLIDTFQSIGMSLSEIKELLDLYQGAPNRSTAVIELREQYQKRLQTVRAQLETLTRVEEQLASGIEFLDGCVPCERVENRCACRDCDRLNDHASDLLMVTGLTV